MDDLSHMDGEGRLRMVDVGGKTPTERRAVAEGWLIAGEEVMRAVEGGHAPKGNLYEAARLAGILAAKRTADLVPLCHPLPLSHVQVDFEPAAERIRIIASASTVAATGVEMEALTAVSVAALTLYDMLKALSKGLRIEGIRLLEKRGGKSGTWRADEAGAGR
ncbi:MAG TPA: cyclic pyranopterin monophosphate synthase MoaC [Bacteroidetes bacterium]|nr:cyclic pyranopterin monophosphate synthase MoaC [Bacteroidota bacterium]